MHRCVPAYLIRGIHFRPIDKHQHSKVSADRQNLGSEWWYISRQSRGYVPVEPNSSFNSADPRGHFNDQRNQKYYISFLCFTPHSCILSN